MRESLLLMMDRDLDLSGPFEGTLALDSQTQTLEQWVKESPLCRDLQESQTRKNP